MTRPYSDDLRERVVRAHLAGEPIRSVAARFGVGVSCVPRWTARYRKTGSVAPGKVGGHRPWLLASHRALVLELVRKTPHLTIDRLRDLLAAEGIVVCRDTIWRYLKREGLSFKKNAVRPGAGPGDGLPEADALAGAQTPARPGPSGLRR